MFPLVSPTIFLETAFPRFAQDHRHARSNLEMAQVGSQEEILVLMLLSAILRTRLLQGFAARLHGSKSKIYVKPKSLLHSFTTARWEADIKNWKLKHKQKKKGDSVSNRLEGRNWRLTTEAVL